jgi:hypothetical protein
MLVTTTTEERESSSFDLCDDRGIARGFSIVERWQSRSVLTPFGWLALLAITAAAAVGAMLVSA